MAITLDEVLNFVIPIFVYIFLFWILYRIPIIQELIDKLIFKFKSWREGRQASSGDSIIGYNTICYE